MLEAQEQKVASKCMISRGAARFPLHHQFIRLYRGRKFLKSECVNVVICFECNKFRQCQRHRPKMSMLIVWLAWLCQEVEMQEWMARWLWVADVTGTAIHPRC
jgi:hypothetical protein